MRKQVINVCMTGSPRNFGWATKAAFLKEVGQYVDVNDVDIKKCDVLVTDDMMSNTVKMQYAAEHGKDIYTYDEFLNLYV